MEKPKSIEELLRSMQTLYKPKEPVDISGIKLPNTRDTWDRIAHRDNFSELGFTNNSEKEEFLKQWIASNPYSNI
jgi:hypothetical protein